MNAHRKNFEQGFCDERLLFHTRVHQLPQNSLSNVWIKREDESGFGISGSKKRKYASLIPFLIQSKFECIGLIGGTNSNNIIGLVQLLRENQLPFMLFLKKNHSNTNQGNGFLLHLLVHESEICWIESSEWPNAEMLAKNAFDIKFKKYFIVPEGATCKQALPGALSLARDIIKNEAENKIIFDEIFIDAGTCLTAISLCLEFARLGKKTKINIVQMADDALFFEKQLEKIRSWGIEYSYEFPMPTSYTLIKPLTGKSFGSVNATVLADIKRYALDFGILTEPIYSAKLFHASLATIHENQIQGNVLIIHSGGGLSLFGFQDKL